MYLHFAIVAVGFLIVAVPLWSGIRYENGNRIIASPLVVFGLNEFSFIWPATVYARVTGISQDNYVALVVISAAAAFLAGYFLVQGCTGWPTRPVRFASCPLQHPDQGAHRLAILAWALLLVASGFYLYQGLPPAVSGLRQLLREGYDYGVNEAVAHDRLMLTKGHFFGREYRGQGVIRFVMRIGWPYLATIALILYLRLRTTAWALMSGCLVAACFVYIAGDGTRGPFLWAMISIVAALSFHTRLRIRTCLWVGGCLVAALIVMSMTQKLAGALADGVWSDGAMQLAERIFIGNAIHSVHAIEFVRTGDLALRWGGIHAGDFGASLPFVNSGTPFVYELFLLEFPDARPDRTTFANTTYVGVLYAEFGWLGCAIGYFVMGCIAARASQALFRRPNTCVNVAWIGPAALTIGQLNRWGSAYCLVQLAVLWVVVEVYKGWYAVACGRRRSLVYGGGRARPRARMGGRRSAAQKAI